MILYALIAGYLPFDEETFPKLFTKIKTADYKIPSFVSDEAKVSSKIKIFNLLYIFLLILKTKGFNSTDILNRPFEAYKIR